MGKSFKKNGFIKDHPKGAKSDSKRKIRHAVKSKLKNFDDETVLPEERELYNQYDISDYKIQVDEPKFKRK